MADNIFLFTDNLRTGIFNEMATNTSCLGPYKLGFYFFIDSLSRFLKHRYFGLLATNPVFKLSERKKSSRNMADKLLHTKFHRNRFTRLGYKTA